MNKKIKRYIKLLTLLLILLPATTIFYLSKFRYNISNLELSLKHFMITEGGLYTLLGSKPITIFDLKGRKLTKEYLEDRYSNLSFFDRIKFHKNRINFYFNNLEKWNIWIKFWEKQESSKYIFCKKGDIGIFVNIAETSWILHKYYDEFYKIVQYDFDPKSVVKEIPNSNSIFWRKMEQSSDSQIAWGLLFGYGEKLSYLFKMGYPGYSLASKKMLMDYRINPSLELLPIPSFKIFSPGEEILGYYDKERKKIISLFHGKDFCEEVLFYLNDHGGDTVSLNPRGIVIPYKKEVP